MFYLPIAFKITSTKNYNHAGIRRGYLYNPCNVHEINGNMEGGNQLIDVSLKIKKKHLSDNHQDIVTLIKLIFTIPGN